MRAQFLPVAFVALLVTFSAAASAQKTQPQLRNPFDTPNPAIRPTYNSQGAALMLNVVAGPHAALDRQVLVKLSNKQTLATMWQTTNDKSQVVFYDLPIGTYELEASAVGYVTARTEMKVLELTTYRLELTVQRDATSVEVGLSAAGNLSPHVRKQLNRAVTDLKSANYKHARKELLSAYAAVPSSGDVNFLLGYIAAQQNDRAAAKGYLAQAAKFDPNNAQALTLLGQVYVKDAEYDQAKEALTGAAKADENYWLPHYLLAETYLRSSEFAHARDEAELALEKGQGSAIVAQVVLGESLANLGDSAGAVQAFQTFLQNSPGSAQAEQVRNLLEALGSDRYTSASNANVDNNLPSDPGRMIETAKVSIQKWQPPGVDELKPQVTAQVTCPQEQVLANAGDRVKNFIDDVSQFAAIEEILHEQLDELGRPMLRMKRDFNYIATISESERGVLTVDEDRLQRSDRGEFPEEIATRGLPTLALIFHPNYVPNFDMSCEGLGQWQGQATWLVHFRQREDRPKVIKAYVIGNEMYPLSLKGRAWISADTYQILRIESELVKPMPEIKLLSDHETVEYAPVHFAKNDTTLFLPKTADLYFDFRRRHYYRRHSFDHFMLFAVDSADKSLVPPAAQN